VYIAVKGRFRAFLAEFSLWTVVEINSSKWIWGLGSFHCISQQEPQ
jgi:agmatine/peptidylarginine deiminase